MRWAGVGLVAIAAFGAAADGAAAKQANTLRAAFLGDATFAIGDKGCDKLKALAAGAPRNLNTVPETLDASGFHSWEGGCSFRRITEVKKGRLYKARVSCGEAADDWIEDDTFTISDGGATVTVTVRGKHDKKTVFQRCVVPAGPPTKK